MPRFAWVLAFMIAVACGGSTNDQGRAAGAGGAGGSAGAGGAAGSVAQACLDSGGWCAYTDGTCGQSVDCFCQSERPPQCEEVDHWVCGCDGNAYHGECEARRAGVDINRSEWTCEGGEYDRNECGFLRCANEEVCKATYTDRPEPSSYDCVHVGQCYTCECLEPNIDQPNCKCVESAGANARIECQL